MRISQKQLKFFFNQTLFYATITSAVILRTGYCFALEQLPPFSHYNVIEQRNIFRPKIEAMAKAQTQEPVIDPVYTNTVSGLDNYALTGIVKIRGKYKATLTDKNSKSGHYVGIGDLIGSLKVVDIQSDRVILEQDNETYELKINTPASPVTQQKTEEEKNASTTTDLSPKEILSDNETTPRTNVMKSIRMGNPNVQR